MYKQNHKQLSTRQKGLYAKLLKMQQRIQAKINDGSFKEIDGRQRRKLLKQLRRYALRLQQMGYALRIGAAGTALALAMSFTTTANAQIFAERTGIDSPFTHFANPFDGEDLRYASSSSFVDIDNDGDLDVFIGYTSRSYYYGYDTEIKFLKNTGTNTNAIFEEQLGVANPFDGLITAPSSRPFLVDIDNDGDLDAFVGENSGIVKFFENTGTVSTPVFVERDGGDNPLGIVDDSRYNSRPILVDIDNDGDVDAFINDTGEMGIRFFENTGDASNPNFIEQTGADHPLDGVSSAPGFDIEDIDGDGDLDAIVVHFKGPKLFENTGTAATPVFTEQLDVNNPFSDVGQLYNLALVDIDGDGDFDVFDKNRDGFQFYKNIGNSSSLELVLSKIDVGSNARPSLVDIDDDGDFDAFIAGSIGVGGVTSILFYKNEGTNTNPIYEKQAGLSNPLDVIAGGRITGIAFVDIDNDGDFDAFFGDKPVKFYENTGSNTLPSFTEQIGVNDPLNGLFVRLGHKGSIKFVDIDSDGDFDLFTGDGRSVKFYENTGDNSSAAFILRTGDSNPFNTEETDEGYYGDYGGYGDYEEPEPSFYNTIQNIAFVDIDNDGDFDAFSINYDYYYDEPSTTSIIYYENVGTVTAPDFQRQTGAGTPLSGVEAYGSFHLGFHDIDNDGDLDAFSGNSDGTLNYYENISAPTTLPLPAPVLDAVTGECMATATAPTIIDPLDNATITGTTDDDLSYSAVGEYIIHWAFEANDGRTAAADQTVNVIAPLDPARLCALGDFSIVGQTVTPSLTAGDDVTVTCTNTYNGIETATLYPKVSFYYSEDDMLDAADALLGSPVSSLSSAAPTEFEAVIAAIPATATAGTRHIIIVTDADDIHIETDETNNMVVLPFTVIAPLVGDDFMIQSPSLSSTSVFAGGALSASCDQCYNGPSTTTLRPYVGYYFSTDQVLDAADSRLAKDKSTLKITDPCDGESATLFIPAATPTGTYYILFHADYKEAYDETNENNNTEAIEISVINPSAALIADNQSNSTLEIGIDALDGMEKTTSLEEGEISLFPNPTNGRLAIKVPQNVGVSKLMLYSATGKLVESNLTFENGMIDLTAHKSGMYFLHIQTEDGKMTVKRVVLIE